MQGLSGLIWSIFNVLFIKIVVIWLGNATGFVVSYLRLLRLNLMPSSSISLSLFFANRVTPYDRMNPRYKPEAPSGTAIPLRFEGVFEVLPFCAIGTDMGQLLVAINSDTPSN